MEISLIYARTPDGLIGANGKLPWHFPKDLRHFKDCTMGLPVIVGRTTFETMPVLLGRFVIVVSTTLAATNPPCTPERAVETDEVSTMIVSTLEDAIALAGQYILDTGSDMDIYIIGGAKLFAAAEKYATGLVESLVNFRPEGPLVAPAYMTPRYRDFTCVFNQIISADFQFPISGEFSDYRRVDFGPGVFTPVVFRNSKRNLSATSMPYGFKD